MQCGIHYIICLPRVVCVLWSRRCRPSRFCQVSYSSFTRCLFYDIISCESYLISYMLNVHVVGLDIDFSRKTVRKKENMPRSWWNTRYDYSDSCLRMLCFYTDSCCTDLVGQPECSYSSSNVFSIWLFDGRDDLFYAADLSHWYTFFCWHRTSVEEEWNWIPYRHQSWNLIMLRKAMLFTVSISMMFEMVFISWLLTTLLIRQ